ncbi:MAG TPA: type I pantothenate kinase [Pseudolysinimonas sp.]|nr:type I pantothenate kinase [Pseudolysinimonas sp.]
MSDPGAANGGGTPFREIDRRDWAALASGTGLHLSDIDLNRLRGLGDALDLTEMVEVYVPLSRLLNLYVAGTRATREATNAFLGREPQPTPFVIGIAGSVAVGKSTIARVLRELLSQWPDTPRVELVTTDGFLWPNAELERRGLLQRKGFPESYDRRSLLRFVSNVKSGVAEVRAPVYSHLIYDTIPDADVVVRRPDVLIVEGLNVLQPPSSSARLAVSDLFDFTIYVDARSTDIEDWYVTRFLRLQRGAFANPASYFHRYADLSEPEAIATARGIWAEINGPNLEQNILPTRARADLVLRKGADHVVQTVLLRKV